MPASSAYPAVEESASNRLFLLGHDIAHSLSPALHAAAFKELGLPWSYELHDEATAEGARAFIGSCAYRAINVTTPYKGLARECAMRSGDALGRAPESAAFASEGIERFMVDDLPGANLLVNDAHGLSAYNTDGEGARLALEREGVAIPSANVLVCGTGATAHAIAKAARLAGAASVCMLSRTASAEGIVRYDDARELFASADIIVNATPVGMRPHDELPFDADRLTSGQVVLDAVYGHGETPFARAATQAGARFLDGCGMLASQAALTLLLVCAHAGGAFSPTYEDILAIMMEALQDCRKAAHALQ